MTVDTPPWLLAMRALDGTKEVSGSGSNPRILAMADTIGEAYPDMAAYAATYTNDDIAWCGLAAAYTMTVSGVRPVWGPTETDRWLWAQAWNNKNWGTVLDRPRVGCVVVLKRQGGGHVTYYERTEGSSYVCRGGNQSDSVNQAKYAIGDTIGLLWPKAGGEIPPPPRGTVQQGSKGPDVVYLQDVLMILPPDGQFGSITKGGVLGFQRAAGLDPDGVVGPQTWSKLDILSNRRAVGSSGLSDATIEQITLLAKESPANAISWKDRGRSPDGYLAGMGMCFALASTGLGFSDAADVMADASRGNEDTDALAWYADEFERLGMANDTAGSETLRHLFVLMVGLGMRESSGRYCEGRDTSASNTSADTAEAGLFQTSWNIRSCSPTIPPLLTNYIADPNGFGPTFAAQVSPDSNDLDNFGSGAGAQYQFLSKYAPAFHAAVTGVGLRKRRNHWGPINRKEVQIVREVDTFLQQVQALLQPV
jgi:uncharacterized protein (TIGR02594 family)